MRVLKFLMYNYKLCIHVLTYLCIFYSTAEAADKYENEEEKKTRVRKRRVGKWIWQRATLKRKNKTNKSDDDEEKNK